MSSTVPKPFRISIPDEKVERLKQKLDLADLPDELENSGWDYGVPLSEMKRLVKAWQEWDWREAERKLNEVPMYTMDVDVDGYGTLEIHFVHQKSEVKGAIPLLFVHGWPGSFIESLKLLPLLSDAQRGPESAEATAANPAFHIIAPSLPNFGFSQGVSARGFASAQHAEACHGLMTRLGYAQYVTQAGDLGSAIARAMGAFFPESCRASHFNYFWGTKPVDFDAELLTERERRGLERTRWFEREGTGYNLLQRTRPQTLAYALHSSPVALLAWMYEKLHDWSDAYPWTDDEIFTWVSVYAFSRAGPGASTRIYYEKMHAVHGGEGGGEGEGEGGGGEVKEEKKKKKKIFTAEDALLYNERVKIGLAFNPMELIVLPKSWCMGMGEVVYSVENEHGGHFYAHEHPEFLARDLQRMFGRGGGAFGVLEGRTGYDV